MRRSLTRRALATGVAAVVAPMLLTACTGKLDRSQELIAILHRTASLARTFTYTEGHGGHTTEVTGRIADDLRYTVDLAVDGTPAVSEVMRDDARALRADPAYMDLLRSASGTGGVVRPPLGASAGNTTASPPPSGPGSGDAPDDPAAGVSLTGFAKRPVSPAALAALETGRWVLDPVGAGPIGRLQHVGTIQPLGADPTLDALGLLQRVEDTIRAGARVEVYNPESIDYRKDLDPFSPPPAGEVRYDVRSSSLPPRASTVGTSPQQREEAVPGESYFSALSIYVKNGVAVRIAESVDIQRRLVADPDQDVLARLADAGVTVPAWVQSSGPAGQAAFIEKAINGILARRGAPPLRQRRLDMVLDFSHAPADVDLPTDAASASLAGVMVRGQVLAEAR